MSIEWKTVVVFDLDEVRRGAVYRELARAELTIPISDIADLGASWPESAWFFVHDDPVILEVLQDAFARRGVSHPIVAYSETLVPSRVVEAIYGGAVSYVQWPCDAATIVDALTSVAPIAHRRCEHAAARYAAEARLTTLSPREREVAGGVRDGLTSKEIGRELGISPRTVEIHRANLLNKIGARNTAEAASLLADAHDVLPSRAGRVA